MSKRGVINGVDDAQLAATAIVLDCSKKRYFKATTAAGNPTCTCKYLPPGESAWLEFTQDGVGGRTITWGAGGAIDNQTVNAPVAGNKDPAVGGNAVTVFQLVGSATNGTTVEIVGKLS